VEVEHLIENPTAPPVNPAKGVMGDRLKKWRAKAGYVFWSEYILGYGDTFPRPYTKHLANTIKQLVEYDITGYKTEVLAGRSPAWQSAVFYMYSVSRLLYDASLDIDLLLKDFCEKFYGPVADKALKYYQLTDKIINTRNQNPAERKYHAVSEFYTDNDITILKNTLSEAMSITFNEPYQSRIRLLHKQLEQIVQSRHSWSEAVLESLPLRISRSEFAHSWKYMEKLPQVQLRRQSDCSRYEHENTFSVSYDRQKIYLYFKLGEADMLTLHRYNNERPLEHTPEVSSLSNVDCFLFPCSASGVYYQIIVNAKGEYYSSRCHNITRDSGYDLHPEIQLRFSDNYWEMIIGINFTDLETDYPKNNTKWKASFTRHYGRYGGDIMLGGWPNGGAWHDVDNSGVIIFSG
jgi:hypothetical protein